MKLVGFVSATALLGGLLADASAQDHAAQDQCQPIGWATRDGRSATAGTITGGGNATPIIVETFADLAKYIKDDQPRVLYLKGTLGNGWKGDSGDRVEFKKPNKTIIGMTAGTVLKAPIHVTVGSGNVIIRNLVINGPGSNTDQAWDNINIEQGAKNVWVDHCEFWDGQDGNADVVKGADNVTFTWNIFGYKKGGVHNLSNLIGSSDAEPVSEGKLDVTFMYNWWHGAAQRQPRCRYGNIHVVNNLLSKNPDVATSATDYGMGPGKDCQILAENNYFAGIQEPFSAQFKAGTAALESIGNVFDGTTGNQAGWGTAFTPPYQYKTFMVEGAKVKDLVQKYAGAKLSSPTSCITAGILENGAQFSPQDLLQRGNTLVLAGFAGSTLELSLIDNLGKIRHHQILSSSRQVIDLSELRLESGIYTAVAMSEGRIIASSKVHLVR